MMRLKRFSLWTKFINKRASAGRRISLINRLEKLLLRFMVLGVVLLTVFQLRLVTNPVDFYLKVMGDFDSPAFKYEQYIEDNQTQGKDNGLIGLYFQVTPESSVLVKQNEKVIGIIGKGISIEVEPGTVVLDATNIDYPVIVDIVLNEKSHQIELNQESKSFNIQLKNNSPS